MIFPRSFSLVIGIFICFTTFAYGATLPPDEVEAFKEIGKTLGKTDWNFNVGAHSCSGEAGGWITKNLPEDTSVKKVTCDCSFVNNTVCHITSIALKSQDLPGMLPSELVRLPYLQNIDLSRNYLNGKIPPEWGSMKLVNISLLGNRLTGPIPKEFGNMSTLATLTVEFNQLSGPIPKELGSLPLLEKLHLTSNNFIGELPETLAKLTTLKDFRIGDNHFTGQIPNFIQNWVNLEKLVIQASGLDGPIPLGISLLTKLSDLRISDLGGGSQATFPLLNNLTSLNTLILRSCNIIGPIPKYLGTMASSKKLLDLSFNKLSGEIPSNFGSLSSVQKIYLTGNLLSGPVPRWMLESSRNIDLSYNNFSESQSCQQRNTNLFRSSSKGNTSGIVSCLGSSHCKRYLSSFHINCGGEEVPLDGNTVYEADQDPGAPSKFVQNTTNWGFSGTGNFLDDDYNRDSFIWSFLGLSMKNSELYVNARLSPISLTYYGFCLVNGIYNVNLHFAEIMFNDGKDYSSLGRRIFHIYIQGELVQKDFNIEDEAGGVGKAIIKNYTANVIDGTLEIRFYWAGKGTTGIPIRGVYGPLISAISVNNPDYVEHKKRIFAGAVVGIVVAVAVAFVIILLLVIVCRRGFLNRKGTLERVEKVTKARVFAAGKDLLSFVLGTSVGAGNNTPTEACKSPNSRKKEIDLPQFSFASLSAATDNFSDANKLGEGGFGPVYKGKLQRGYNIAVKRLSRKSGQGLEELQNEAMLIAKLQHKNLVILLGWCIERDERILIYEYMPNKSLDFFLFDPIKHGILNWELHLKIIEGIAQGLLYLHRYSRLQIIHRDLKASNILLDKDMNPKISDFGMARIFGGNGSQATKRIVGTYGYMSPEYALEGIFSVKSDVFSFGVLLLEILSGKRNTGFYHTDSLDLLGYTWDLWKSGRGQDVKDPTLEDVSSTNILLRYVNIGLLCVQEIAADRPTMSDVVSMLSNEFALVPSPKQPAFSNCRSVLDSHKRPECCSKNDVTISILEAR